MATITIAVGPNTKSKTISAADITRVLNALRTQYGKITVAGVVRDRTDAEVFDFWSDRVLEHLKDIAVNIEGDTAKAALTRPAMT